MEYPTILAKTETVRQPNHVHLFRLFVGRDLDKPVALLGSNSADGELRGAQLMELAVDGHTVRDQHTGDFSGGVSVPGLCWFQ